LINFIFTQDEEDEEEDLKMDLGDFLEEEEDKKMDLGDFLEVLVKEEEGEKEQETEVLTDSLEVKTEI
jgi:hypothetical protein